MVKATATVSSMNTVFGPVDVAADILADRFHDPGHKGYAKEGAHGEEKPGRFEEIGDDAAQVVRADRKAALADLERGKSGRGR